MKGNQKKTQAAVNDVQRKAQQEAERIRKEIRREQIKQPHRITAPPVYRPSNVVPSNQKVSQENEEPADILLDGKDPKPQGHIITTDKNE
ncbi:MAG: hypothetical protein WAO35_00375 [Terriglobia bacterium]